MTTARRVCWKRGDGPSSKEWLVGNGLGGYASGTIEGAPSRRFHGMLIAAFARGRFLAVGPLDDGAGELLEFALEDGLPVWRYASVERRVIVPHGRNATLVAWRALRDVELLVRPAFQVRPHEGRVDQPAREYPVALDGLACEIDRGGSLPILMLASRGEWRAESQAPRTVRYAVEAARGYDSEGPLVWPCALRLSLRRGEEATLFLTTDAWDPALDVQALRAAELARRAKLCEGRQGLAAELALAADAFVIRKLTGGPEDRTVIAGYHWFTDWGRDTMISLEGLCLCTGRFETAARILRTFAGHVRDGLIPNLFPEGESQGLYHTADATLWFFHALHRYTQLSRDASLWAELEPALCGILDAHLRGTKFGIGVDPADGLLRQGAPGYQLTWMDAKMGDWVVTPRRGKAVELNALFYNALCLVPGYEAHAARLRASFNRRFVNGDRLFDVLDPDDPQLRPNQLLAISLPHPVLDEQHWKPVLQTARRELFTPFGLRSLGPREPAYQPRYDGDLRARDGAYHQGTVWAWLIGPFLDAWRKAFPGEPEPQTGFAQHLADFGTGSIAEIFDGDEPHAPRGCIAQAWSVAEVLRTLPRSGQEALG